MSGFVQALGEARLKDGDERDDKPTASLNRRCPVTAVCHGTFYPCVSFEGHKGMHRSSPFADEVASWGGGKFYRWGWRADGRA